MTAGTSGLSDQPCRLLGDRDARVDAALSTIEGPDRVGVNAVADNERERVREAERAVLSFERCAGVSNGSGDRHRRRWSRSTPCPSICSMMRVTAVTPLEPPFLRVEFSDGLIHEIDCGFLLHGTLGEPLEDPDYFRQVRVDDELRTILWPNGLDPAPQLLHGDFAQSTRSPSAQPHNPAAPACRRLQSRTCSAAPAGRPRHVKAEAVRR